MDERSYRLTRFAALRRHVRASATRKSSRCGPHRRCGAIALFAAGRAELLVRRGDHGRARATAVPRMLGALPHSESTPPLYYVPHGFVPMAPVRQVPRLFGGARDLTVPATYAAAQALVPGGRRFCGAPWPSAPFQSGTRRKREPMPARPARRPLTGSAAPAARRARSLAAWAIVADWRSTHYFALFPRRRGGDLAIASLRKKRLRRSRWPL
jgi:hypothetical protein